jgi:hypothetical protein
MVTPMFHANSWGVSFSGEWQQASTSSCQCGDCPSAHLSDGLLCRPLLSLFNNAQWNCCTSCSAVVHCPGPACEQTQQSGWQGLDCCGRAQCSACCRLVGICTTHAPHSRLRLTRQGSKADQCVTAADWCCLPCCAPAGPMVGARMVLPGPYLDGENIYALMDTYRVTISTGEDHRRQ